VTGLNPSPVRAVTGKDHLTVSARGASSLITNISTSSSSSPISASLAKLPNETSVGADAKASRATISSLLDQLTEIHDRQQDERKSEWDTFLRKRQKALAAANSGGAGGKKGKKDRTKRGSAGSEVVGIGIIGVGQMGRSGKEEERKMFGRLVRGGIPLAYRSDIWAGTCLALLLSSGIIISGRGERKTACDDMAKTISADRRMLGRKRLDGTGRIRGNP